MKRTRIFAVHRSKVQNLEERWNEYKRVKHLKHMTLNAYVNMLLDESMRRQEFRIHYAPSYRVIGLVDNVLHIRNHESNKIYQIVRRGTDLFCLEDNDANCKHVMFAVSTDEVSKLYDTPLMELMISESKRIQQVPTNH